jgi:hypothetical protein
MLSTQVVAANSTATTAQLEVAVALADVCKLDTAYPELESACFIVRLDKLAIVGI